MSALELLAFLQDVEQRNGRIRQDSFAPRTLDLDLLAFDRHRVYVGSPPRARVWPAAPTAPLPLTLFLPHPRMHLRRFVLIPLAEIDPKWTHPLLEQSVTELLQQLGDRDTVKWHCANSAMFL